MKADEKLAEIIREAIADNGGTQTAVGGRICGCESTFKRRLRSPSQMSGEEMARMFRVLNFNKQMRDNYVEVLYSAEVGR